MSVNVEEKSKILSFLGDNVVNFFKEVFTNPEPKKKNYADSIIRNKHGEVLLVQRSAQDDFMPGKWALPGGKIEVGETEIDGAKRELSEETGLSVDLTFLKAVNKPDCTINYFSGIVLEDNLNSVIVLDNEEHWQYEFVAVDKLSDYDLLLDLGDTLNELVLDLPIIDSEEKIMLNPEEVIAEHEGKVICKAFDDGLISEDDFITWTNRQNAFNTLKKAHNENSLTEEQLFDCLEKAKHYEFVKVNRDGKTFYQYREVGSDAVTEDLETGDTFDTGELGLTVKKYTDKSFLITGDTYKNLELLRKIKEQMGGFGSWNKSLGGWVFPAYGKDKMLGLLASKMPESTYEESVAKEKALDLKNAVDVGTEVTDPVTSEPVEVAAIAADPVVTYAVETTVDGETETKEITEKEVEIPPATDGTAIINNVTEESRFKSGKELFGKGANEASEKEEIEEKGQEPKEIEAKEFTTRSGKKVNALDFTEVRQDEIQLVDQETVLSKGRPYYIPEINEYQFTGYKDDRFLFDYTKMADGNFLVCLKKYSLNDNADVMNKIYSRTKDKRDVDPTESYAVMSIDNLVAMTEYYKTKRKAELKKEAEDYNKGQVEKIRNMSDVDNEKYKTFHYTRLSTSQRKKISEEDWNALSKDEKMKWVEGMSKPVYGFKSTGRIKPLDDNTMMRSSFDMYKEFVDSEYKTPTEKGQRGFSMTDPCAIEFYEARQMLKWKKNDLSIQKEENSSSYIKGKETSYGDSNTKDDLLESHGVKIKTQNGSELDPDQINDIKHNLTEVYKSFGDRSDMAKKFGLKISHAGDKKMHASKALGLYIPSMKAIGVSNSTSKFGFTLAHEFAHFIDNYLGKKNGRNFASDDYQSTAGQIANQFRSNMNKATDDDYLNRTCECFARAMEQYHAVNYSGEDAIKHVASGVEYHKQPEHVSKEKFNTIIKPLIDKLLTENDHLLKSAFRTIRLALDNGEISEEEFLKGIKHSEKVLQAFAKETPETELRRVIKESKDEKLRKAAHDELERRTKKEKPVKDK